MHRARAPASARGARASYDVIRSGVYVASACGGGQLDQQRLQMDAPPNVIGSERLLITVGIAVALLALLAVLRRIRRLELKLLAIEGSGPSPAAKLDGTDPETGSAPSVSADDVQCKYVREGSPAIMGVPRTLSCVLRQSLSVLDFGAKNDGVSDCTAAIQRAIDAAAGHTVHFPPGAYVVTRSLKVTNRAAGGMSFTGQAAGYFEWTKSKDGTTRGSTPGSCIVGRTGSAPVFDCAGSQFVQFSGLSIQSCSDDPNYSTCGVFIARTKESMYSQ